MPQTFPSFVNYVFNGIVNQYAPSPWYYRQSTLEASGGLASRAFGQCPVGRCQNSENGRQGEMEKKEKKKEQDKMGTSCVEELLLPSQG